MTHPIHVDFNRRDADDNLVASTRRVDLLPRDGQTVDIVDDEGNRALARVVRAIDARRIVLEPLWPTFVSAGESRMVPSGAPTRFLETWSTATTVSYRPVTPVRDYHVQLVSGGPARPVPA